MSFNSPKYINKPPERDYNAMLTDGIPTPEQSNKTPLKLGHLLIDRELTKQQQRKRIDLIRVVSVTLRRQNEVRDWEQEKQEIQETTFSWGKAHNRR